MPAPTGNALYEADKWESNSNNGPPPAWDGTAYTFADANGDAGMYCDHFDVASGNWVSNIAEGRTIEFDLEVLVALPSRTFAVYLDDSGTAVATFDMSTTGVQHYASDPLAAGAFVFLTSVGATPGAGTFKLTPTGTEPSGGGSGCFWTDFVGCIEDCSDTPPPVDPGVFNLRTWNMPYQIGCCSSADDSCVQTDGQTDSFGDVSFMADALDVPGGSALSPTMAPLSLVVPVRSLSRGTPPSCVSTLPAPRIAVTVALTPPPGGTPDWDFLGGFGTVPFIALTGAIYSTPDGSGSPAVSGGVQYGDMHINTSVTPWTMTTDMDIDLSDSGMPDTENASVVVTLSYTGSDTSGTPIALTTIDLSLSAVCPC